MATTYANQNFSSKYPIPEFDKKNPEDTAFARINVKAMGLAMADLTNAEFKVWCYLAKNAEDKELGISPAHALSWGGISKDTFHKAFKVLIEKKYLVPKGNSKTHFTFYETPIEDEIYYVEKADSGFKF